MNLIESKWRMSSALENVLLLSYCFN